MSSTGIDSRRISFSPDRPALSTANNATGIAASDRTVTTRTGHTCPTNVDASTNAGIVATSPTAVTNGAVTLSGSQPKRTEPAVSPNAVTKTAAEASTPPSTLIVMKSARVIEFAMPNTTAAPLASTASATDVARVKTSEARTFSPTTDDGRRLSRNVPAWIAVPSREPSAPKMFPRSAIAAGTINSRPGSASRRSVLWPNVTPASNATTTSISKAARRSPRSPSEGDPIEEGPIEEDRARQNRCKREVTASRSAPEVSGGVAMQR